MKLLHFKNKKTEQSILCPVPDNFDIKEELEIAKLLRGKPTRLIGMYDLVLLDGFQEDHLSLNHRNHQFVKAI